MNTIQLSRIRSAFLGWTSLSLLLFFLVGIPFFPSSQAWMGAISLKSRTFTTTRESKEHGRRTFGFHNCPSTTLFFASFSHTVPSPPLEEHDDDKHPHRENRTHPKVKHLPTNKNNNDGNYNNKMYDQPNNNYHKITTTKPPTPPLTTVMLQNMTAIYLHQDHNHPSNHVHRNQNATMSITNITQTLHMIQQEHRVQHKVPLVLGGNTYYNSPVAVLLSWAALYQVSSQVTVHWLRSLCPASTGTIVNTSQEETTTAALTLAAQYLDAYGWEGVQLPQGLAVGTTRRFPWNHRRRIEESTQALKEAQQSIPPTKPVNVQELRNAMEQTKLPQRQRRQQTLDYFPSTDKPIQRISWRRLKRSMDKQYATLKRRGRAGFVSYAFFNFLLYTIGVSLQWQRIAPGDPMTNTVSAVMLRKFGRVFASLYVVSNLAKIPKLFMAVGMTPLCERILQHMKQRWKISETTASVVLVVGMVATWAAVIAVPIVREFTRLRHLVQLEKALYHAV